MTAVHGPVVLLYFNCRLLEERIVRTSRRLQRLTVRSNSNLYKVNKYLRDLGTIIDELQRCDFFWSSYLAMNFYIALSICSIAVLCSKFEVQRLKILIQFRR